MMYLSISRVDTTNYQGGGYEAGMKEKIKGYGLEVLSGAMHASNN